jgi:hypothetical protein
MEHIEQMLTKLERSFGRPRQAVDLDALQRVYGKERNMPQLVKTCAQAIFTAGMPRIRVGVYKNGWPRKGIAFLQLPAHVPPYGTRQFRDTCFTMGFHDTELRKTSFCTTAFAVAHELSHIILYSVNHPLQDDERVVDLTAMFFGFAEVYAEGKTYVSGTSTMYVRRHMGMRGVLLDMLGKNALDAVPSQNTSSVGYLSSAEMHYACSWIVHHRL